VERIVVARSKKQVSSAKRLILDYAASLGVDLSFQGFDREMAEFPSGFVAPDGRLLIAVEDGEAVGVVGVRKLSRTICELKRMYVRPESRGKGIGRMLAERAVRDARDLGYSRMRLDTLARLEEAVRLYESMGFKRIQPYTFNPTEGVLFMELDLRNS